MSAQKQQQQRAEEILKEIQQKELEIQHLKHELSMIEQHQTLSNQVYKTTAPSKNRDLSNAEISRYSRQLTLPEIGMKGQVCLRNTTVLIVGAGGLGCPSAIYLAAAGIGCIGIVDYDEVELSNLHRQILHTESKVGISKCLSVAEACNGLNSFVRCVPHHVQLDSSNALGIVGRYDIVLDATDNVATRYLLNDACVIAGKPLVSGSALRFEGQLTVYNHERGPCYRCLYPKPPPPEMVTNCSDGGVLGVVPGIIGCLQALEAIKIACNLPSSYSQRLLMYDCLDGRFMTIRLRGRQTSCSVCGDTPSITRGNLVDYEQFCGAKASDKDKELNVLQRHERITAKEYASLVSSGEAHVLVDVRLPVELDICRLPTQALNIPLSDIEKQSTIDTLSERVISLYGNTPNPVPVICVCRRGNDSQLAVQKLRDRLRLNRCQVKDILGGLTAWAKEVDNNFPTY
ncbi:adenylyltransferase and sulfurtransferase MOCS3-like [Mya arenaria]|uniref:adenylyltransferase and sulfurtransferase MOCS3-like n=1 Tax=Mya arenaria TaxID=6604 RepID=UPI0022DE9FD5|nr:adenylyltransferase and sulfurtransferase MOCS3-like [Mya arenaria]